MGTSVKFLSNVTVNVDAFHCVHFGKPEQENSEGTRLTLSTVAGPRPNSTKPPADTTAGSGLLCATVARSIGQLRSTGVNAHWVWGLGPPPERRGASGAPVGAPGSFWGWGTVAMQDGSAGPKCRHSGFRGKSHVSFTTIKVSASLVQP